MNQNIKEALSRVAERLRSLSQEEFEQNLRKHSQGDIASTLIESREFFQFNVMNVLGQVFHRVQYLALPPQEFHYATFDRAESANDDCFMMAA